MSLTFEVFFHNLSTVKNRILEACAKCSRSPDQILLLPVTKTHPATAAIFCHQAGLHAVAENRVQEAVEKQALSPKQLSWELIGHLQSNKARQAVESFFRIQSVDSIKMLSALAKHQANNKKLHILLQINAGNDPAKYGAPVESAAALLDAALQIECLQVDGLMTIAPLSPDQDIARRCFSKLRDTRDCLEEEFHISLPELSMGMSSDLEIAIAEGATILRIGSALFGERP